MKEPRCYFYNDYHGMTALMTIGDEDYQRKVMTWFEPLSECYGLTVEKIRILEGRDRVVRVFSKPAITYLSPLARRLTRGVYEISVALGSNACPPKLVPERQTRSYVLDGCSGSFVGDPPLSLVDALSWEYFSVPGYVIYPHLFAVQPNLGLTDEHMPASEPR